MLRTVIQEILETSKDYKNKNIEKEIAELQKLKESTEKIKDFKLEHSQSIINMLDAVIKKCEMDCHPTSWLDEKASDKAFKASALKAKIELLKILVDKPNTDPAHFFIKLTDSTSILFNQINNKIHPYMLDKKIDKTIPSSLITEAYHAFAKIAATVQVAEALLHNHKESILKKEGVDQQAINLGMGKCMRRKIEVPLLKELMIIRVVLNIVNTAKDRSAIEILSQTVDQAVAQWLQASQLVNDLRQPLLKQYPKFGAGVHADDQITSEGERNLENYNRSAARIIQVVETLKAILDHNKELFKGAEETFQNMHFSLRRVQTSVLSAPPAKAPSVAKPLPVGPSKLGMMAQPAASAAMSTTREPGYASSRSSSSAQPSTTPSMQPGLPFSPRI